MGRLATICWLGLCLVLGATGPACAQEPAQLVTREALQAAREHVVSYYADKTRGGIALSTSVPASVRLWFERGGAREECSGVLVSSRKVLTAAHCICGDKSGFWLAADEPSCRALVPSLSGGVFVPTDGFARVSGVEIHPRYHHPGAADVRDVGAADLAVLTLDRPVAAPPARIGGPKPGGRYLSAGFGEFSLNDDYGPMQADHAYQAGLSQLVRPPPVRLEPGNCGSSGLRDTFCMLRAPASAIVDTDKGGGVCAGDSGGGLYELTAGPPVVVGLNTFFTSRRNCRDVQAGFSHATNLGLYASWVVERVGKVEASQVPPCADAPMFGQRFALDGGLSFVSITVADDLDHGIERPTFVVEGLDERQCAYERELGVAACRLDARDRAIITLDRQAYAQVTVCWGKRS